MSSLSGGPAAKSGSTYESYWGVRAMIELLHKRADSLRIEEPRVDGAEFWIESNGEREYWQVKRQLLSQQNWTLSELGRGGVLSGFLELLRAGHRCIFASITDAPELRVLAERAVDAQNFEEFSGNFLVEQKWRKEFDRLREQWSEVSEIEVFEFLRKVEVQTSGERLLEENLCLLMELRFNAAPKTTLSCLRALYQDSVHQVLTAESIYDHLAGCEIHPRRFETQANLIAKIRAITGTYISGRRQKLIRGQLMPRSVARELIGKISGSESPLDLIIIGGAGSGKSGCLLEIVEGLEALNIPVLAFRLDQLRPVQTTISLGSEMGLPESPAMVVGRAYPGRDVVLVVDQLDFVSTTSGRHPDFFDTVAALIREVRALRMELRMHLVLACREFDFKNDARLRSLLPKDGYPFSVAEMEEKEVLDVVVAEGGDPQRLNPFQLKLLRTPQNLALFVESGLVRADHSGFGSQKELFDSYWRAHYKALSTQWSAESVQWLPIIETLVNLMNETQELSVPATRLDGFSPHFVEVMVSAGVLTFDGRRYGFGHESFFDYCFARIFSRGPVELIEFLERDDQHLFRRAQTR